MPKIAGLPKLADFTEAVSRAKEMKNRQVEMVWRAGLREYFLTVIVTEGNDPLWTLMADKPIAQNIVLQHPSIDLPLIETLVLSACTGENPDKAIVEYSSSLGSEVLGLGASSPHSANGRNAGVQATMQDLQTVPSPAYVSPFQASKSSLSRQFDAVDPRRSTVQRAMPALEGDISNLQLPTLLQSIQMSKMTGKLSIAGTAGNAELFFEEGEPTDVLGPESQGDAALLELLTWVDGGFKFVPNERSIERSVTKRLDTLIMQGIALLDQNTYLIKQGLTMESFLLRRNAQLTEKQFEEAIANGAPIDIVLQKRFYQQIDNKSTFFDLLRRIPLSKADWLPVMFNLLTANLVALSESAPRSAQIGSLQGEAVNPEAIKNALKVNSRPETGIFTHPFVLYCIQQEFYRFEASSLPFSLLLVEMVMAAEDAVTALPPELLRDIFARLNNLKRKVDVLGHYEMLDYALLLPFTAASAASMVAKRLVETVSSSSLDRGYDPRVMRIAIGIASVPEDCRDISMLLAAAKEAKRRAKQSGSPIVTFGTLHL
jgi:hypothetical protein